MTKKQLDSYITSGCKVSADILTKQKAERRKFIQEVKDNRNRKRIINEIKAL